MNFLRAYKNIPKDWKFLSIILSLLLFITKYSSILSNINKTEYLVAKNSAFGWYSYFFEFAQSIKNVNFDRLFGSSRKI